MNILFACHAGFNVGLGHLSRVLVASEALRAHFGAAVCLLIQGDSISRNDLEGFPRRFIGRHQDLCKEILGECVRQSADIVILDLHPGSLPASALIQSMLFALRAFGCRVVGIDGLLQYRAMLDLIFMPSFNLVQLADVEKGAPIVYGWDCFLLNVCEAPREWKPGPRVLALTGGSDVTGLGQTWPALLDSTLPSHAEVHWVSGPFAQLPLLPLAPRIAFHNHIAPSGLGSLMQSSCYAVTVFGVSFFELLYLGIPTVVFSPYGRKDDCELNAIAKAGVALVARDEREAAERLSTLMHDESLAVQLSQRARALLGTPGASRLCSEIAALMQSPS